MIYPIGIAERRDTFSDTILALLVILSLRITLTLLIILALRAALTLRIILALGMRLALSGRH
ncbi:MAG: hypothetical protein K5989_12620 [Lachnospiraceae bacterium]|nr:hypothetical protein [Lachnospiraceae bacterium]